MIYEIQRELGAELRARGCPIPVAYGPEPYKPTAVGSSRIVVERVRERGSEPWGPAHTHPSNPRTVGLRQVPARVRIYCSSGVSGARVQDHERLMDQVVALVHVALYHVIGRRNMGWRVTAAGMPSAEELALPDLERWSGAVYEIRLSIDVTDSELTWTGDARPEAPIGGVGGVQILNTTAVQLTAQEGDESETACGGN